jgi:uncharacterized membrane protein YgdD (TMEM256/DUF423 family)
MSTPDENVSIKFAAALGASGVGLGAIGAHAFKKTLTERGMLANWQTATMVSKDTKKLRIKSKFKSTYPSIPSMIKKYQLVHAVALLGFAANSDKISPVAGKLLALGTTMFSGSIFCLSLNIGPKPLLGPTTPLGGLLMIGGWVVAGFSMDTDSANKKAE